jgi:hypothetical protein
VWIGQTHDGSSAFNDDWHGAMLRSALAIGATPVYYAYVIAFLARGHAGLDDCDVGTAPHTLCGPQPAIELGT